MLSRKSVFWIPLSVILLTAGILFRVWQLFVLLVPIVVFYSLSYLTQVSEKQVKVMRHVERTKWVAGDEVNVSLFVRNKGPSIFLELYDKCSDKVRVIKGTNHALLHLGKNGRTRLRYTLKLPLRGKHLIGGTHLRWSENCFMEFQEEVLDNAITISVLPKMDDLRKVRIRPKRVRNWLGLVQSKRIGIGTEFFSLREYVQGDDRKRINWKASARCDKLITNEYEGERCGDIIIILDARREVTAGPADANTTEAGVRAALTIASKILKEKNRVGLITISDYLDWVFPGFGKSQFYKIADKLTSVEPGGLWSVEYLKWVVSRFFPPRTQLLIISPLTDRKVVDIIIELCRREFSLLVISPSSLNIEMMGRPQTEEILTAATVLRMERDLMLKKLSQYATAIDWNIEEPLAAALQGVTRFG